MFQCLARCRSTQAFKFVVRWKFCFDNGLSRLGPCLQHGGQTVIGLRAEHEVHLFYAPSNFSTLGLRHTARNRDHHILPRSLPRLFHFAYPAQFGINLV